MAGRPTSKAFADAPRPKLDKATLRKPVRIFRYLRQHRLSMVVGFILLLTTTSLALLFPGLLGQLVDAAKVNAAAQQQLFTDIDRVAMTLFAVFLGQAVFGYLRIVIFNRVTTDMLNTLRTDTYEHLLKLRRVAVLEEKMQAQAQAQSRAHSDVKDLAWEVKDELRLLRADLMRAVQERPQTTQK